MRGGTQSYLYLSRHSDLIANPVQIRANVHLSRLRGVPPVIAASAMATAHLFVRAFNSRFCCNDTDAE